ncbi:MAG: Chorismate synthase [Syntrophomonadaceae bacterium]|nr:Chorismate synthase [Bacillota bacterium]
MRYLTAGESHGPALLTIVEGLPANLQLDTAAVDRELERRQGGFGRGGRMKIERDRAVFLSGLRFGRTLGSPLAIQIANRDHDNWLAQMATVGTQPEELARVTLPRPGHADLAAALKYNLKDIRDVLERASARETAARVAVGAVARQLLAAFNIRVASQVLAIGEVASVGADPADLVTLTPEVDSSPVRCPDIQAAAAMQALIEEKRAAGDSLGGVFEVVVTGVPAGLGSHVHWDRKLDGRLAAALMSVQAIKGVEVGGGFACARLPGSRVHDEIAYEDGRGYFRRSNRAGGIEGGVTNGEPLVLRAAMKPIPTLTVPLPSVEIDTHRPGRAAVERSDVCAVPAASIVGEAVVAWEVACALREKLGGDSLEEMREHWTAYNSMLTER